MLEIKVIASGSAGNCTMLTSTAGEKILLDAGIPYKIVAVAANYEPINFALITYEHCDHANKSTIKKLLERGTEVYMTTGTKDALKLETRHNLHSLKYKFNARAVKIGSCKFKLLEVMHDAAEPVAFQIEDVDDTVLYVADAKNIPYGLDDFKKLIVGTNFSEERLKRSDTDSYQKQRIFDNHISIERAFEHFDIMKRCGELEHLREVHLIHISQRHGNAEEFKHVLASVFGDIPIYTH